MPTTRPPRRGRDDLRRTELIQAATRVVARDGIAAATTRRVAEEAGVPSGLVHYWFAGKDDLLQAVVADTLRALETAVAASHPSPGGQDASALDRLRAAFEVVRQDRGRQLALYEMTTWVLRKEELRDVAREQYAQYRRVATNVTADWLRGAGLQASGGTAVLAQFVAALFDGLVLAWLADPEGTDVDGVLRLLGDLAERLSSASSGPAAATPT